ncbi:MAG: C-GCAxxG-C-C family protein [Candidatus Thorarchaeota archaeon]
MTHSSEMTRAVSKLMDDRKAHCAQAVFATFGPFLGSKEVGAETCMKIASAFSGGINGTGNICGALTGALMAIGLEFGNGTPLDTKVAEISTRLLEEFTSINGSILCRELIPYDVVTKEGMMKAIEKGVFKNCTKYAEDVSRLLSTYLA